MTTFRRAAISLVVVIVGGMGSIIGAMVAAILLALGLALAAAASGGRRLAVAQSKDLTLAGAGTNGVRQRFAFVRARGCTPFPEATAGAGRAVHLAPQAVLQRRAIRLVTLLGFSWIVVRMMRAFVDNDAQQCGFCTPGFVTTISAYLKKNPNPSLAEVREACKGNFCRCGTYPRVFEAALAAAKSSNG